MGENEQQSQTGPSKARMLTLGGGAAAVLGVLILLTEADPGAADVLVSFGLVGFGLVVALVGIVVWAVRRD